MILDSDFYSFNIYLLLNQIFIKKDAKILSILESN